MSINVQKEREKIAHSSEKTFTTVCRDSTTLHHTRHASNGFFPRGVRVGVGEVVIANRYFYAWIGWTPRLDFEGGGVTLCLNFDPVPRVG